MSYQCAHCGAVPEQEVWVCEGEGCTHALCGACLGGPDFGPSLFCTVHRDVGMSLRPVRA